MEPEIKLHIKGDEIVNMEASCCSAAYLVKTLSAAIGAYIQIKAGEGAERGISQNGVSDILYSTAHNTLTECERIYRKREEK